MFFPLHILVYSWEGMILVSENRLFVSYNSDYCHIRRHILGERAKLPFFKCSVCKKNYEIILGTFQNDLYLHY